MTRDEEIIQTFETKAGQLLETAEQYLMTALPAAPGAFAYIVVSSLVGKLFGNTREYVQNAINRPVTLPDFIYIEPLDEELEVFFDDTRLQSVRADFPQQYGDFSNDDWVKMRRAYMPLYYTLVVKEPLVSEMFAYEIQSQNYKRIVQDFDLFPIYKKAMQTIPSASRQNSLWTATTSILKGTVKEIWSKDYAKQLIAEAKVHPEIASLIEEIKVKVEEKVNIQDLRETIKYVTGRSISTEARALSEFPGKVFEFVAKALPNGRLGVPAGIARKLHLRPGSTVRMLLIYDE